MASGRAKVEIAQEDLNGVIRKWQGEILGFHFTGSYEDIARKNVNFLASVNGRTARVSAKDLQQGLKEVLGEADTAPSARAKTMAETLSWCNKRSGNKELQRLPPAAQTAIHAGKVEAAGGGQHSPASTPPSSAKLRGSPGAASAASGGAAPSAADQGAAILALYGARGPPRKRKGDEGAHVAPSQETVASGPPSTRKARAALAYQAEKTATFKEDEDWVEYNTMELVRARHCPVAWLGLEEERFRLRQGTKGFAVITVDGEADGERGSSQETHESDLEGAAGGSSKRGPAAADRGPAAADEKPAAEDRGPSLEVEARKPRSQVRQWTAGDYPEAQMREMAAGMVSRLRMREIAEATVTAMTFCGLSTRLYTTLIEVEDPVLRATVLLNWSLTALLMLQFHLYQPSAVPDDGDKMVVQTMTPSTSWARGLSEDTQGSLTTEFRKVDRQISVVECMGKIASFHCLTDLVDGEEPVLSSVLVRGGNVKSFSDLRSLTFFDRKLSEQAPALRRAGKTAPELLETMHRCSTL
ncbi:unnamed protein product [Prorocentrum cordatum]|uniref:Uncharacterized protein n=1 Tax=Prorocentrum cordatum TaxID=2364126 RepID=A0ABN9Y0P2_9DINO|nr:unnamed protein product [Polarella glacialis]